MANLTTTADLKSSALKRAGELTTGSSKYDAAVEEYLNLVYQEIISGGNTFMPDLAEPWTWARAQSPGLLALLPPYSTGSVSLTQDSTAGSFSVAPTTSMAGRHLVIDGRPEFFKIATHTASSTSFTLDGAYTDATASGLTFRAHLLDYTLSASSSLQRLVEPMRVYRAQSGDGDNEGKIYGMNQETLSRQFPLHLIQSGIPTHFAIIAEANGVVRVRFNKTPSVETRVEYDYVPTPAALTVSPDTTPIIPYQDRIVLVYGATYFLMVDKSDSRADAYFRYTQSKLQGMLLESRKKYSKTSKNFAKLVPRLEQTNRAFLTSASGLRY